MAVNRVWARYMGAGLVEPVDDWDGEAGTAVSHPELLDDLARDFVASGYDLKALARRIFQSRAYQARPENPPPPGSSADHRRFAGPARRRMSAEQVVDSLFAAAGKSFGTEELCVDPEGRRPPNEMLNLGRPGSCLAVRLDRQRARPTRRSRYPVTQTFVDLMQTFGWRPARQDPLTVREEATTPLQPASIANGSPPAGPRGSPTTRPSPPSASKIARLPDLVRIVYLRVLSRPPTDAEASRMVAYLGEAHADRVVPAPRPTPGRGASGGSPGRTTSTPGATEIQLLEEKAAREGDPPTYRLRPEFRERMEDVVWALFNSPEFVLIP